MSLRYFDIIEDLFDDIFTGLILGFCFVAYDESVPQYIITNSLYILRRNISPALDKRVCLRGYRKKNSRAGRGTVTYERADFQAVFFRLARCINDIDNVILYLFIDVYLIDDAAGIENFLRTDNACCIERFILSVDLILDPHRLLKTSVYLIRSGTGFGLFLSKQPAIWLFP